MRLIQFAAPLLLLVLAACGGSSTTVTPKVTPAVPKWGQSTYTIVTPGQTSVSASVSVVAGTNPLPASVDVTIAPPPPAASSSYITYPTAPITATSGGSYQVPVSFSVTTDGSGAYPVGSWQFQATITVNGVTSSSVMTLIVQ